MCGAAEAPPGGHSEMVPNSQSNCMFSAVKGVYLADAYLHGQNKGGEVVTRLEGAAAAFLFFSCD